MPVVIRDLLLGAMLVMTSCQRSKPEPAGWRAGLETFRAHRHEEIAGPDGWLTLVARTPLDDVETELGSAVDVGVTLPADRSPPKLGILSQADGGLRFITAPGADVRVAGVAVTELELRDDSAGSPTMLEAGSLRLHVIRRGSRTFLRVKDQQHPARTSFGGLSWFTPAPAWRFDAKVEPVDAGTTVAITNVLGQVDDKPVVGVVSFEANGAVQRLLALEGEAGGLFVLFKDQTAGAETYPSGRFLETGAPDAGRVELDFNRATNPPCAFTSFATCPIPPRANALGFRIEAGERYRPLH